MNASSDSQLLQSYAKGRSEAAFSELVRRHLPLVHSAALRITGDPHLSKDVSQGVFVALARDAGRLAEHQFLCGWLHRSTRNIAAQTLRAEVRRRAREKQAAAMIDDTHAPWQEIALQLDAALAALAKADRDAILLRYFEKKSAREVADLLGISAEAAQKRVQRAIERLKKSLAKRGVHAGSAGLVGSLSANAVQAPPPGLGTLIASNASAATVSYVFASTSTLAMTALQKCLAAAVITALAGTAIYLARQDAKPLQNDGAVDAALASRTTGDQSLGRGKSLLESIARSRAENRQKELTRLRELWLETGGSNDRIDEQNALAKESVDLLSCSGELFELVGFLMRHEFRYGVSRINSELKALFQSRSPRAAEARRLLATLPGNPVKGTLLSELDTWSNSAGYGCPPDEFEAFHAALRSERVAQEALFGRNRKLMTTDPDAAIRSTLGALRSGLLSVYRTESLKLLFWEELPADVDFAKLEQLLPPDQGDVMDDPVARGREELFRKWTETDPMAAISYLLADPDRLGTNLIATAAEQFSQDDIDGCLQWIESLPDGSEFDVAAKGAMSYARISRLEQARELAARIGDLQLREESLKILDIPPANPHTR